jgi:uncharacterized protein (TIGR03435 family)
VLDETGLKGNYDFTLAFAARAAERASGPSIFDALQEQLGLNLQDRNAPSTCW